ncbi:hypothetical protein [Sandarakinorhabdus sp.]|uniref:hypothetical protein n=1 Tax=Sandarakinorhabdus sp. TaxID=1916663 RepID=UPI003F72C735
MTKIFATKADKYRMSGAKDEIFGPFLGNDDTIKRNAVITRLQLGSQRMLFDNRHKNSCSAIVPALALSQHGKAQRLPFTATLSGKSSPNTR